MKVEFTCALCGIAKVYTKEGGGTTGYAHRLDSDEKVCFDCCAREDIAFMRAHDRITLYLNVPDQMPFSVGYYPGTGPATSRTPATGEWTVTNWPGTLSFKVIRRSFGAHNVAGRRYDVWVNGPDGHVWHGVQYGDMTQICRCRRTKELWAESCGVRIDWPIKTNTDTRHADEAHTGAEVAFLALGTTNTPDRRSVAL